MSGQYLAEKEESLLSRSDQKSSSSRSKTSSGVSPDLAAHSATSDEEGDSECGVNLRPEISISSL